MEPSATYSTSPIHRLTTFLVRSSERSSVNCNLQITCCHRSFPPSYMEKSAIVALEHSKCPEWFSIPFKEQQAVCMISVFSQKTFFMSFVLPCDLILCPSGVGFRFFVFFSSSDIVHVHQSLESLAFHEVISSFGLEIRPLSQTQMKKPISHFVTWSGRAG